MADAQSFVWYLVGVALIAAAAKPAFAHQLAHPLAHPLATPWALHSGDLGMPDQPPWTRREPIIGNILSDDLLSFPAWSFPLGPLEALGIGTTDRDRRGLSFGIRRDHGFKGTARLRF